MSAPFVESYAITTFPYLSDRYANMPSGIVAGDLLLCFCTGNPGITITSEWAWSAVFSVDSPVGFRIYSRVATGSDGLAMPAGDWKNQHTVILRVSGANAARVEVQAGSSQYTKNHNPPSLTSAYGASEKLWIGAFAAYSVMSVSAAPAGYDGPIYSAALDSTVAVAHRQFTAAAEDPGSFTASSTQWGVSVTLAINEAPTPSIRAIGYSVLAPGAGLIYSSSWRASGIGVLGYSRAEIEIPSILIAESAPSILGVSGSVVDVTVIGWSRGPSILGFCQSVIAPVLPNPESIAAISYTLTLTGSPDIIIPISSWQMRRRLGGNAWLSCVAPGATPGLIAAVSERVDGNLILRHHTHMLSGAVYIDAVLDVALSDFRYDRGTQSASITLTSNVTRHNTDPQTRPIWGETYRAMSGGIRRARFARVDPELQPGDTVVFADGESWVVGSMTTWVGARESNMEISEAETD